MIIHVEDKIVCTILDDREYFCKIVAASPTLTNINAIKVTPVGSFKNVLVKESKTVTKMDSTQVEIQTLNRIYCTPKGTDLECSKEQP